MSDLIHEGPKDPNKPPVPGEEKPTTERERMKKVYTYVAILFTVAFLLILWTFFMNQRSINEIKDGLVAGDPRGLSGLEAELTISNGVAAGRLAGHTTALNATIFHSLRQKHY